MEKFVPKRKAGDPPAPAKKRPARRGAAAKKTAPTDPVAIAKQAVARTDRLVLEEAIVALVTNGKVSVEDLAELGVAPAPVAAPREKVTATAELRSTGTMGSWEPLDQVIIVTIIEHVGAVDKFQLSETCKGLCALRREPRCWRSLDVGKLDGLTASGLRRLPSSIPTTRIECLRLDEGRGSSFGAADWVAFLKQLECKDTLKRLNLATKKFGAGAKALKAVEPLVGGVEALRVVGIKNPQGVMDIVKKAPRLVDLEVISSDDVGWEFFLTRLAQVAAGQRGAGAKSLLKRFAASGWCFRIVTAFPFVASTLRGLFPELQSLEFKGLSCNCVPIPAPAGGAASRLRVLKLKQVEFVPGSRQVSGSSYWGPQTEAMSSEAVATYVANCEAAFPALEVWWTSRECESISTKERKAGAKFQPPPVLDSRSLAVRFPHLREFTLVNVDVDKHSFVNWDAPSLEKVHLDPVGTDTYPASTFVQRFPSEVSRKPIVQPLLDGAEGDVAVDWSKINKYRD